MYVIGHYDSCMEFVSLAMVVQTVLKDGVSRFWSEGDSIAFAECNEYCASCFLIVRQFAAVFVHAFESLLGH